MTTVPRALMTTVALAAALAAAFAALATAPAAALASVPTDARTEGTPADRVFDVFLDERAMGTHRFDYSGDLADLRVRSEASFIVKIAFVTVYRYEHLAEEHWLNGCLVGVESTTDTDEEFAVSATYRDGGLDVRTHSADARYDIDCPSTFAYWDPALRTRTELVSAQDGERMPISWTEGGEVRMTTAEGDVEARSWTLLGEDLAVTIYYDDEDRWIGLDSPLENGRTLRYRPAKTDPLYPFD